MSRVESNWKSGIKNPKFFCRLREKEIHLNFWANYSNIS